MHGSIVVFVYYLQYCNFCSLACLAFVVVSPIDIVVGNGSRIGTKEADWG